MMSNTNNNENDESSSSPDVVSNLKEPLLPTINNDAARDIEDNDRGLILSTALTSADNNNDDELLLSIHSPTNHSALNHNKDITFHCCCCCTTTNNNKSVYRINHNVFVTLLNDLFYGTADSLWGGTILVAYLKKLGHEQNGPVGWMEAISGLTMLLTALPVGYLADTYGRSIVIKWGGFLFIVTVVLQIIVMEWMDTRTTTTSDDEEGGTTTFSFLWWSIIMGLWGMGAGIVHGPCEALYADSTPAGERSQYYLYLMIVYSVASCIGPLVTIILFQTCTGNDWDLSHLRTIIYVGLGLEVISSILMMFYDDEKALTEEEGGGDDDDECEDDDNNNDESDDDNIDENHPSSRDMDDKIMIRNNTAEATTEEEPLTTPLLPLSTTTTTSNDEPTITSSSFQKRHQYLIPYILFTSTLISAIGSGMTVKFFPLFFKDTVGMSPTQVQIIYVLVPLVMASCSGLGTFLAGTMGRVQVTILLQCGGVSCLYGMVFFQHYLDQHPVVLVPIYILRTALMNCPYPLQESILMDYVSKSQRARWKSLESIASFGWCGSAALGGYLSDHWSYGRTFFVTALTQSLAILIFALLLPLVPRREGGGGANNNDDDDRRNS